MTVKKQVPKYKITFDLPFGPFKTAADVTAAKRKIKAKVPKMAFSAPAKAGSGYTFKGRLSYLKAINAPKDVVLKVMKERSPRAKITVNRV